MFYALGKRIDKPKFPFVASIICVAGQMRLAGHVARVGKTEMRTGASVEKTGGKRSLLRIRHVTKYNIKCIFKKYDVRESTVPILLRIATGSGLL
jgi:hypothetical protein